VSIPSVNPQGNPGTNTRRTSHWRLRADFLRRLEPRCSLQHVEIGRPMSSASSHRTNRRRTSLLRRIRHGQRRGMTIGAFRPGDSMKASFSGVGSTDTKGPMAAARLALHEWAQVRPRAQSRIRWSFLALMGEEAATMARMRWRTRASPAT